MVIPLKEFGKTGKKVFVLGLGTYGHGDAYGGISKESSLEVMKEIIKNIPRGDFFIIDTAPRYGNGRVEKWIGEFIKENGQDNILIATKGGRHIEEDKVNEKNFSAPFLRKDLDNSLKRLGVNKVFLYQLHNPDIEIIKAGAVFRLLEQFRNERKIEFYGLSVDSPDEGIEAIEYCKRKGLKGLASIQIIYNILQKRGLENLFEIAKQNNIAIIAREPILRGFLSGKYQNLSNKNLPEAVKKQINLFGEKQILESLNKIKDLNKKHGNYDLTQLAIKFTISNPNITLTIPGINRLNYINTDLESAGINISSDLILNLEKLPDLRRC